MLEGVNAEFMSRLDAFDDSSALPELAFDLGEIVPSHMLDETRREVSRVLGYYVVLDDMLPQLLQKPELWAGADFPEWGKCVVKFTLPECFVRLHWVYANQPLAYHPHGLTDIIGIKSGKYNMDLGHGELGGDPPLRLITDLPIQVGSVYPMYRGAWHEIRHPDEATSISLNIKDRRDPCKPPRVTENPPLSPTQLGKKLEEFAALL